MIFRYLALGLGCFFLLSGFFADFFANSITWSNICSISSAECPVSSNLFSGSGEAFTKKTSACSSDCPIFYMIKSFSWLTRLAKIYFLVVSKYTHAYFWNQRVQCYSWCHCWYCLLFAWRNLQLFILGYSWFHWACTSSTLATSRSSHFLCFCIILQSYHSWILKMDLRSVSLLKLRLNILVCLW